LQARDHLDRHADLDGLFTQVGEVKRCVQKIERTLQAAVVVQASLASAG